MSPEPPRLGLPTGRQTLRILEKAAENYIQTGKFCTRIGLAARRTSIGSALFRGTVLARLPIQKAQGPIETLLGLTRCGLIPTISGRVQR
jgi:hypothetical protein